MFSFAEFLEKDISTVVLLLRWWVLLFTVYFTLLLHVYSKVNCWKCCFTGAREEKIWISLFPWCDAYSTSEWSLIYSCHHFSLWFPSSNFSPLSCLIFFSPLVILFTWTVGNVVSDLRNVMRLGSPPYGLIFSDWKYDSVWFVGGCMVMMRWWLCMGGYQFN